MLRQESIGILKRVWETAWGLPGFVRPKKDGTIWTIEDLRKLDKCVIRKVYPLPRIQDIMHRPCKYKYFTKINISMQCYTFMLDDKSTNYVIIVTPFGKWRCIHVPMGFLGSTDWAQATMEDIFQDMIQDVKCYINDIGIFDNEWDEHISKIDLFLARLEKNGFTVNPLKCEPPGTIIPWAMLVVQDFTTHSAPSFGFHTCSIALTTMYTLATLGNNTRTQDVAKAIFLQEKTHLYLLKKLPSI
jgi:hypothetical protein